MAQPNGSVEQLIEKARSGDRRAQQELWHAHRRWVAAIVLAHRPRSIDVDDLMQDVAVKFISKLETLRDPGAFKPWLRQITLNICRGAGRSYRPNLRLVSGEPDRDGPADPRAAAMPQASDEPSSEIVARREAARQVLSHALTLPPEYREPLLLRCLRAMTYQQIGELLDLPVTTIETRLARARKMLRDEIGEQIVAAGFV